MAVVNVKLMLLISAKLDVWMVLTGVKTTNVCHVHQHAKPVKVRTFVRIVFPATTCSKESVKNGAKTAIVSIAHKAHKNVNNVSQVMH